MGGLRLSVLGPLEVLHGGGTVQLPGPRETALLALLAARYPQGASAQALIDDLWEGRPPGGAPGTLRAYVSTLRRALRDAGLTDVVRTVRRGEYALSASAGEALDARLFEELLRESTRQRACGDLDAQARTLWAALRLWRGEAFAEVAAAPGVAPAARRLEERRLVALESWAQARVERGDHAEFAAELAPLCTEHPFRERLWELRMLALYRAGRQADALAVYREARAHLREQLGAEPGGGLQELELAILRHDPALRPRRRAVDAAREQRVALPLALREPRADAFVGRVREIEAVEVAWALASSGRGQLAMVYGEPGIGKSALVGLMAARLAARGALVLAGRCDADAAAPYQPLREAIAPLLAAGDRGDAGRAGLRLGADGELAGRLAALFPELAGVDAPATPADAGPRASVDPQTARLQLFEAVTELVLCAALEQATVLVLEDLHWADPSTLLLVRHLARRCAPARLLIVGTHRDTELRGHGAFAPMLEALAVDPGFTEVRLGGLSESELAELLARHGHASGAGAGSRDAAAPDTAAGASGRDGGTGRATLARRLHRATAGNPLFVQQALAYMSLTAAADGSGGASAALGEIALAPPPGVREAIDRRLAGVGERTREVLSVAAVVGVEFELELVQACSGEEDALGAIEQALRAGLLAELSPDGERLAFVHELVRDALYTRLSRARRARMHERVGEALEALGAGEAGEGADPGRTAALAEHFAAAARPAATAKAVAYARAATGQALAALAFDEAALVAERGLRSCALARRPDQAGRCALNLLLAEARLLGRDIEGCKRAALSAGEDARALGSPAALARAATLGSHLNTFGVPSPALQELSEDALAAVEDDDVAAALVLAGMADHVACSQGDGPAAERLSADALARARRCGDDGALARALFVHAEVLGWSPRVRERLALASELLLLAERRGDPQALANARHVSALARLECGDVRAFDAEVARIERLRARIDYWYTDMFCSLWRGMRALVDGRLDDVEPAAGELLAHAQHEPNVLNLYLGQIIWLRREQGRLTELRPLALDAIKANPHLTGFRCALALLHSELGELDEAAAQLQLLAADGFAALPRDATFTLSLALLAEVAARVGDAPSARTLGELLRPYAGLLLVATKGMLCVGAADRYLGMLAGTLGEHGRAQACLRRALALERRVGAAPLVRRTESWAATPIALPTS